MLNIINLTERYLFVHCSEIVKFIHDALVSSAITRECNMSSDKQTKRRKYTTIKLSRSKLPQEWPPYFKIARKFQSLGPQICHMAKNGPKKWDQVVDIANRGRG